MVSYRVLISLSPLCFSLSEECGEKSLQDYFKGLEGRARSKLYGDKRVWIVLSASSIKEIIIELLLNPNWWLLDWLLPGTKRKEDEIIKCYLKCHSKSYDLSCLWLFNQVSVFYVVSLFEVSIMKKFQSEIYLVIELYFMTES